MLPRKSLVVSSGPLIRTLPIHDTILSPTVLPRKSLLASSGHLIRTLPISDTILSPAPTVIHARKSISGLSSLQARTVIEAGSAPVTRVIENGASKIISAEPTRIIADTSSQKIISGGHVSSDKVISGDTVRYIIDASGNKKILSDNAAASNLLTERVIKTEVTSTPPEGYNGGKVIVDTLKSDKHIVLEGAKVVNRSSAFEGVKVLPSLV